MVNWETFISVHRLHCGPVIDMTGIGEGFIRQNDGIQCEGLFSLRLTSGSVKYKFQDRRTDKYNKAIYINLFL